jgi:hypothetical protein
MRASNGFGIHVGQYTGAFIRFASFCQPALQAAGQDRGAAASATALPAFDEPHPVTRGARKSSKRGTTRAMASL